MRLVVLGSGTCVPSGQRSSSGYWIEAGAARLRLDCGSGTVHAMARFGLPWTTLTHQVITHFHIDHVGELPALLFALRYGRSTPRSAPLSLVGPNGLRALVEGFERLLNQRLLEQEFPVDVVELAPDAVIELGGGAKLRVAKTPHTTESLAVRVEHDGRSIGYTGDTSPSDELADFFAGVDLLVAECSFLDNAKQTPHLCADDVARLATMAGAGRLLATHSYFDPEAAGLATRLARGYAGPIGIAEDGMLVAV
ncbi:MAG: ribonuclease Z [Myxococcales bacterium]|nr:ribonuclease Z [Myxococcales bacterium]